MSDFLRAFSLDYGWSILYYRRLILYYGVPILYYGLSILYFQTPDSVLGSAGSLLRIVDSPYRLPILYYGVPILHYGLAMLYYGFVAEQEIGNPEGNQKDPEEDSALGEIVPFGGPSKSMQWRGAPVARCLCL